jgi:hypothetical protein
MDTGKQPAIEIGSNVTRLGLHHPVAADGDLIVPATLESH